MDDRNPTRYLHRIMYILNMNWHRYGRSARIKYLIQFKKACEEAIDEIDRLLKRYNNGDED